MARESLPQSKIVCTAYHMHSTWRAFFLFLAMVGQLAADGLIPPLGPGQIEQARKILTDFKTNPKGPYFQIR